MPANTRESGHEILIITHLTTQNGFELGTSADYSCEYTLNENFLFRSLKFALNPNHYLVTT